MYSTVLYRWIYTLQWYGRVEQKSRVLLYILVHTLLDRDCALEQSTYIHMYREGYSTCKYCWMVSVQRGIASPSSMYSTHVPTYITVSSGVHTRYVRDTSCMHTLWRGIIVPDGRGYASISVSIIGMVTMNHIWSIYVLVKNLSTSKVHKIPQQ